MKKFLCVLVVVISLIIAVFFYFESLDKGSESSNEFVRVIPFSFEVTNDSPNLIDVSKIRVLAPSSGSHNQELLKIEADFKYDLKADNLGNNLLEIDLGRFKPYETKLLSYSAEVKFTSRQISLSSQSNLESEKYIEINDEFVQAKVGELGKVTYSDSKKIVSWINSTVTKEGYLRDDKGAKYALRIGKGDCTEFMYLGTAIFRLNKISSRGIAGFVLDRKQES